MKILVVDDDRVLADLVAYAFRREGYDVIQAHDGNTALSLWASDEPDLIVLDVNLPDQDGFSVCRQIRAEGDTPIIMLTVRSEEDDLVHGLEIGADDYIAKPFSPRQLLARTQAVLRRTVPQSAHTSEHQVGGLYLDTTRREVTIGDGDPMPLTPLETRLLSYLMLNRGHILTTQAIIDHVWGAQGGSHVMLRQLVHRLRNKIEPNTNKPRYIETISGLGYGFVHPDNTSDEDTDDSSER